MLYDAVTLIKMKLLDFETLSRSSALSIIIFKTAVENSFRLSPSLSNWVKLSLPWLVLQYVRCYDSRRRRGHIPKYMHFLLLLRSLPDSPTSPSPSGRERAAPYHPKPTDSCVFSDAPATKREPPSCARAIEGSGNEWLKTRPVVRRQRAQHKAKCSTPIPHTLPAQSGTV